MESSIDTDRFIIEIESRPAIWNKFSDDYSNRDVKKKSWEELVNLFIERENPTVSEKNQFGKY